MAPVYAHCIMFNSPNGSAQLFSGARAHLPLKAEAISGLRAAARLRPPSRCRLLSLQGAPLSQGDECEETYHMLVQPQTRASRPGRAPLTFGLDLEKTTAGIPARFDPSASTAPMPRRGGLHNEQFRQRLSCGQSANSAASAATNLSLRLASSRIAWPNLSQPRSAPPEGPPQPTGCRRPWSEEQAAETCG